MSIRVNKEKILNNLLVTDNTKVPRYETLSQIVDEPGKEGNVILIRDAGSGLPLFYGHDGITWVPLSGGGGTGSILSVDGNNSGSQTGRVFINTANPNGPNAQLNFRGITGTNGIAVTEVANNVQIDGLGVASSVTLADAAVGTSLVGNGAGPNLTTRVLVDSPTVTVSEAGNQISFTAIAGGVGTVTNVSGTNLGAGQPIFDGVINPASTPDIQFNTITGGTGITVNPPLGGSIEIENNALLVNASTAPGGNSLVANTTPDYSVKGLVAGDNISITALGSNDLEISVDLSPPPTAELALQDVLEFGNATAGGLGTASGTGLNDIAMSTGTRIIDATLGSGVIIETQSGGGASGTITLNPGAGASPALTGIVSSDSVIFSSTTDQPIMRSTLVSSADNTGGDIQLLGADVMNGIFELTGGGTGSINIEWPTSSALITHINSVADGMTFNFVFVNNSSSPTVTFIEPPSDLINLNGSMVVEIGSSATFVIRIDSVGPTEYSVFRGDFIQSASGNLTGTLFLGNSTAGGAGTAPGTLTQDIAMSSGTRIIDASYGTGLNLITQDTPFGVGTDVGAIVLRTGNNLSTNSDADSGYIELQTGNTNQQEANTGALWLHTGTPGSSPNAGERSGHALLYTGAVTDNSGAGWVDVRTQRAADVSNNNIDNGFGNMYFVTGTNYSTFGTYGVPDPGSGTVTGTAISPQRYNMVFETGPASTLNQNAGAIFVRTGAGAGGRSGGDYNLQTGVSGPSGSAHGGHVNLIAGNGNTVGDGGTVTITSGAGGTTGDAGDINITAGASGTTSGNAGNIIITAGDSGGDVGSQPGDITMQTGSGGGTTEDAGDLHIELGTYAGPVEPRDGVMLINGTMATIDPQKPAMRAIEPVFSTSFGSALSTSDLLGGYAIIDSAVTTVTLPDSISIINAVSGSDKLLGNRSAFLFTLSNTTLDNVTVDAGSGTGVTIALDTEIVEAGGARTWYITLNTPVAGDITFYPINAGVESGTWSPTLTVSLGAVIDNVALENSRPWRYTRIGNIYTCSGSLTAQQSGAGSYTLSSVDIELPNGASVADAADVSGSGGCGTFVGGGPRITPATISGNPGDLSVAQITISSDPSWPDNENLGISMIFSFRAN